MSDDFLIFAEDNASQEHTEIKPWKILIADDEQAVHLVTRLALGDFTFENRPLELLSAYTEDETRQQMQDHPDIALVLLDVVMDTIDSGFDIVKFIRDDLKNKDVRIIMRTGQSGNAPEDRVIINYDINDFKDKTELTVAKLRTTLISSLRAYSHLKIIAEEQKKLAGTKTYLRTIINSLSSVLLTLNRKFEVVLWNDEAVRWSGITSPKAEGQILWNFTNLFDPFKGLMEEVLSSRKSVERNFVPLNRDQLTFVNFAVHPLETGDELELLLRIDDVTESKKKEELLNRNQKIHALNALSTGFAAELNKIMMDIRSAVQPTAERKDPAAETVLAQASKATDLLQKLMSLGQKQEGERVSASLSEMLRQMVENWNFPPQITVETRGLDQEAGINCYPADIEQVFRHLVTNAVDALTWMAQETPITEPRLKLSLEKTTFSSDYRARHPEVTDGPYWKFELRDNGVGMSPDVLSKIFDPYFSTKPKGKGVGLGMAYVYNMVDLHNGLVDVSSELGKGTSVLVYLPAETTNPFSALERLKALQGSGMILICDDEPMMRQVAGNILKRFGYEVLQAGDGITALDIFNRYVREIKLVILDMLLPGMTGLEIFREMKNIDPKVKVLLSSGFGRGENVEQALEEGVAGFLQKPYGFEKLGQAVQELLKT